MDRQQRELRRAAAEAFAESLSKLEQTLSISESEAATSDNSSNVQRGETIDLEQAFADLERFMQEKEEQN
ncbi:hypothetical protein [Leptolyngbya sp. NIES-2104]|uniref:hypothetical protein n=1 Tax=Leptolyngbya sp. NIES-2104 TaxID=1552121 RepID=UPI0006EC81E0|nr:hypothetical protein [Leptolyngbya sp. NIES-2104]GAP95647.1 hypothetical protein NIES2104_21710 [Leptolyngbya sp. NIES-2104]